MLLFLVYQMTINSPSCDTHGLGYKNPFADYIQLLPKEISLPTFYTVEERELLKGTSLADALTQKMNSLEREFESLKSATQTVAWCQRVWWDEDTGCLEFADWMLADAVYRSRAMELPRGVGLGMVPVVDMANHASDERYNARFEVHEDAGVVMLVVRDKTSIEAGDEITIMYGPGGACEMIFSYGFLDEHASSARELFLNLSIPTDDPLRMAKIRFAQEAPGVRVYVDGSDQVHWESKFVWWACINQEDGLDFQVEQTVTGGAELKALWKDQDLQADALHSILVRDALRDVFMLRAIVMIQQRVEYQGTLLAESEDEFTHAAPDPQVRWSVHEAIGRLRRLELELLARAYESLEKEVSRSAHIHARLGTKFQDKKVTSARTQKVQLLESSVVREYLGQGADATGEVPDDFS